MKSLSRVRLFATPWTVAYQAPPSMGFSRQEYWSGLPFPSPGDLPDPGIEWVSRIPGRRFNLWATREAFVLRATPQNRPRLPRAFWRSESRREREELQPCSHPEAPLTPSPSAMKPQMKTEVYVCVCMKRPAKTQLCSEAS